MTQDVWSVRPSLCRLWTSGIPVEAGTFIAEKVEGVVTRFVCVFGWISETLLFLSMLQGINFPLALHSHPLISTLL